MFLLFQCLYKEKFTNTLSNTMNEVEIGIKVSGEVNNIITIRVLIGIDFVRTKVHPYLPVVFVTWKAKFVMLLIK